ncbi:hypothetical protein EDD21DRAFT_360539 [Dissophora ornata]|nr:hypothetical protein EDD21DRAFT_360539 [Dissophora ornata]
MDMLVGTRNTRKRQHEPEAEQSPRQPKKAKLGPSTELEGQAGPSTTQPTSPSSVSVSVSRLQKTPTQRRQRQGQGQGSSAAMFKGESQRQRHYRPVPDLLSATTIPTTMSAMTDMQIADARRRSANEVFATVLARDLCMLYCVCRVPMLSVFL